MLDYTQQAVSLNHCVIHIDSTVTKDNNVWANLGGYNCVRLLMYAYEQHINVLKHFVYV